MHDVDNAAAAAAADWERVVLTGLVVVPDDRCRCRSDQHTSLSVVQNVRGLCA